MGTQMNHAVGSISSHLAQWVGELKYSDLNVEITSYAKRFLLDSLAVAWAGSRAIGTEPVHTWVVAQGGIAESRVWLSKEYLPATSAAFLNGIYAAALDFVLFSTKQVPRRRVGLSAVLDCCLLI